MLCMYVVLLELYTTIKKTKYSSIYFVNTINWWCWPWPPFLSSSIVIFITDYCSFCSTKLCLNKSVSNSCSIGKILFVCCLNAVFHAFLRTQQFQFSRNFLSGSTFYRKSSTVSFQGGLRAFVYLWEKSSKSTCCDYSELFYLFCCHK